MRLGVRSHFLTALAAAIIVAVPFICLRHLERPRLVEGVWLWQFEGSMFYEGASPENVCDLLASRGSWLNFEPEGVLGSYDARKSYPSSGEHVSQYGSYRLEAFSVRFAGNQRFSLLGTGHLSAWSSEFEVYKMLEAKPIQGLLCKVPFP